MTETLEQQIEREILEHKQKHGNLWVMTYWNNFDQKLPRGFFRGLGSVLSEKFPEECYSDKKNNLTGYEFIEEFDKAIKESKIAEAEILEKRKKYGLSEEYFNFLKPIYLILRKKGYTRKDLCA
jgi:hypothetical protein